ncbi:hypothetical protein EU527_00905 [Candidatus Thorarchaeota archaeon]|nr:MAG: hypothetical protein EU527_00905 [Candidatus Thorarchaeota archaeon]
MADDGKDPTRRRGSALLVTTIIIIASIGVLQAIPIVYPEPNLDVRVAVIDSGINIDTELESRVIAQMSFVNTTYGYPQSDSSITDSAPSGTTHGTYISKIIASRAPHAGIVNAKVVAKNDLATIDGLIAAIRWSVLEQNCSVINLSLGLGLVSGDLIAETIEWAFNRGVSIIAAAGNSGQNGIAGSSIDSPAAYPEVIAVAGVDEQLNPYYFSGIGPLRDRIMKPDIAAWGYYRDNGVTVFGTSFAAPVVSAVAVQIIAHCIEKGWSWTPGLLKAVIMASAINLPVESWLVGAGLVDLGNALSYLTYSHKEDGLPYVAAITPTESPFSFEYIFVNHSVTIPVSIFTSTNTTFILIYSGVDAQYVHGPEQITVNQTGLLMLEVCIISNVNRENVNAVVLFIAKDYQSMRIRFEFDARIPYKQIAFDISHTPWAIDSIYGQFRTLARKINNLGSSVDELRSRTDITFDTLSRYDAIFVLDPCAWDYYMVNNTIKQRASFSYSQDEIDAYLHYWEHGGSLFLIALSNLSIDIQNANALYNTFNISLNYDMVPPITLIVNGIASTTKIHKMINHPVTNYIDYFDYNGCSLNYTDDVFELAWAEVFWTDINETIHKENRTVLVGLNNSKGGRLLATGSNFFVDNWALNDLYQSKQNWKLVLQALYWLLHILDP